jgi:hypothetical protein
MTLDLREAQLTAFIHIDEGADGDVLLLHGQWICY